MSSRDVTQESRAPLMNSFH